MKLKKIHIVMLLATAVVVSGHVLGMLFHWYEAVPHYDSVLHFLGGFWTGSILVYLLARFGAFPPRASYALFLLYIGGLVLTVGFLWELYELLLDYLNLWIYGLPASIQISVTDPMKDMVLDWLGGMLAASLLAKKETSR